MSKIEVKYEGARSLDAYTGFEGDFTLVAGIKTVTANGGFHGITLTRKGVEQLHNALSIYLLETSPSYEEFVKEHERRNADD